MAPTLRDVNTAAQKESSTRHRRISAAVVRRLALALPDAVEKSHFGQPDFRVNNRIFATLPRDELTVCLKTTATNLDALVSVDSITFRDIWRGRWVAVRLDRVSQSLLRNLIVDAWQLAAPRRLVASFRTKV